MKRHKWSADNIAFGSGGVLELCSLLQMLMIFLLHVKPQFAQFSAAYLGTDRLLRPKGGGGGGFQKRVMYENRTPLK